MLGVLASNWRASGILSMRSGQWLDATTGRDLAGTGIQGNIINQVIDDPYGDQSTNPANSGIIYFNAAAFAQPAPGTFGTMQRNSVRGPGSKNLDMALSKLIRLNKTKSIEVRAEAFNAFNWFTPAQPGVNLQQTATFGQILQIVPNSQRIFQFAVKFGF